MWGCGGERGHIGWGVHAARLGEQEGREGRPGPPPPMLSQEVRAGQQACPGN